MGTVVNKRPQEVPNRIAAGWFSRTAVSNNISAPNDLTRRSRDIPPSVDVVIILPGAQILFLLNNIVNTQFTGQ